LLLLFSKNENEKNSIEWKQSKPQFPPAASGSIAVKMSIVFVFEFGDCREQKEKG